MTLHNRNIGGVPEITGTFVGVSIKKGLHTMWGVYIGVPLFKDTTIYPIVL